MNKYYLIIAFLVLFQVGTLAIIAKLSSDLKAWKRTALHTANAKKAYETDVSMAHAVAREAAERRFKYPPYAGPSQ